jgi:hypothetical protein
VKALDRVGRVLVLVLSTLATLSIVASLVSVSSPDAPEPRPDSAVEIAVPPPGQPSATPAPEAGEPPATGASDAGTPSLQPEQRDSRELAKWLRALTYAVLGLTGFVAVLVIVAMRATAHLGAIADRR